MGLGRYPLNIGKVWEWIPMNHQLWKAQSTCTWHSQPNYTPKRDIHFDTTPKTYTLHGKLTFLSNASALLRKVVILKYVAWKDLEYKNQQPWTIVVNKSYLKNLYYTFPLNIFSKYFELILLLVSASEKNLNFPK